MGIPLGCNTIIDSQVRLYNSNRLISSSSSYARRIHGSVGSHIAVNEGALRIGQDAPAGFG